MRKLLFGSIFMLVYSLTFSQVTIEQAKNINIGERKVAAFNPADYEVLPGKYVGTRGYVYAWNEATKSYWSKPKKANAFQWHNEANQPGYSSLTLELYKGYEKYVKDLEVAQQKAVQKEKNPNSSADEKQKVTNEQAKNIDTKNINIGERKVAAFNPADYEVLPGKYVGRRGYVYAWNEATKSYWSKPKKENVYWWSNEANQTGYSSLSLELYKGYEKYVKDLEDAQVKADKKAKNPNSSADEK